MAHTNGYTNGNGVAHEAPPFQLKDEPIENLRPLKVRVIGAGFSGILAAIRIPEKLRNIDLVVYEKNEGIGGVWWMNKYPGLACDVPSHSYQYTFAPNPHWSSLYAPGAEIQQYLQGVAERFGATRFIRTRHQLLRSAWDERTKKWALEVRRTDTGEVVREDDVDVVIAARGLLNEPSWPDIAGLDRFKGKIMHSAEWDESYDFRNKRVGVVGNGSSAIQIVPSLQPLEGIQMTVFMRSPTWISGQFGDAAMVTLGLDPADVNFTPEKRAALAADPATYLRLRKVLEDDGNSIHDSTLRGTALQRRFAADFAAQMRQRLAGRPDLCDALIPGAAFAPGCRRLTPGRGYLEALVAPNVDVVCGGAGADDEKEEKGEKGEKPIRETIAAITDDGTGVVLRPTGRVVAPLDALVCATGFQTSAPPAFEVVGRGGRTLRERWADPHPESYLSVMVDGFPNYLMLFGPNSAIGFGSLTKILEQECDYCVQVLRKLQKEDYAALEPRPERVRDFQRYVGAYFANTVYVDKCKSWYRSQGGRGDWIIGLWPGSTLHALEALRSPRWEDFVYESVDQGGGQDDGNALRWLGNGWSVTQTEGDPSWYINPDEVEWPKEGKPEEHPRYKNRPWSH